MTMRHYLAIGAAGLLVAAPTTATFTLTHTPLVAGTTLNVDSRFGSPRISVSAEFPFTLIQAQLSYGFSVTSTVGTCGLDFLGSTVCTIPLTISYGLAATGSGGSAYGMSSINVIDETVHPGTDFGDAVTCENGQPSCLVETAHTDVAFDFIYFVDDHGTVTSGFDGTINLNVLAHGGVPQNGFVHGGALALADPVIGIDPAFLALHPGLTITPDNVPDVSLTGTVPEPAAWTLMITGFGLVCGALRRRTSPAAAA